MMITAPTEWREDEAKEIDREIEAQRVFANTPPSGPYFERALARRAAGLPLDCNEKLILGELPKDPFEGTVPVSRPSAKRTGKLRAHLAALTDPSTITPDLLAIVRDTREQEGHGYWFAPTVPMVVAKLDSGDYAPFGYENRCAIERKTLGDYIQSITWEHARFRRELDRLKTYDYAAVVVEASHNDVTEHRYRSKVAPHWVFATTATLSIRYCPIFFCGDRKHAASFTLMLLERWWTHARKTVAA